MIFLPDYALGIIKTLKGAGYEAYAVGGCVRDAVMGKKAVDVDITTSAKPDEILALFPRSALTGGAYFTVTVLHGGGKAEVTPFRSEGGYSDSRRPDSVAFATELAEDLKRRDFTINTLCFDGERIIDLLGGIDDINAMLIRCVGEPERRFSEDALRIMRAFRFSASLGFDIEQQTLAAALACSDGLRRISVERIRDELIKLIFTPAPERLTPLLEHGALGFLKLGASPLLAHLNELPEDENTRLAAFLDVCGRNAAELLKLPTKQKRFSRGVFAALDSFPPPETAAVKRMMSAYGAEIFLASAIIAEKIHNKGAGCAALCREILKAGEPFEIRHLAIDGSDLLAAGVPETEIGAALTLALDTVIDDPGSNTRDALLKPYK